MGEFRIGHQFARHSYPDNPRAAALGLFARNFAWGPDKDTFVTTSGIQIPWFVIDNGAAPGVDVPITPRVTGVIRIVGAIVLGNNSNNAVNMLVQVQIGNVTLSLPFNVQATVDIDGFETIPIVAQVPTVFALPIGIPVNVEILVTAGGVDDSAISLIPRSSTLEVQEVPAATG